MYVYVHEVILQYVYMHVYGFELRKQMVTKVQIKVLPAYVDCLDLTFYCTEKKKVEKNYL